MAAPGSQSAPEAAPQPASSAPLPGGHGPGARFAGRVSSHAAAYGFGALATALAAVLSVAVVTRFLEPAEFGKMAVLSTVATLVTAIATLGIMQGTMRRIFGSTGDEEMGEIEEGQAPAVSSDPRLALSTGFAMTAALGLTLLLGAWAWQEPLAALMGADEGVLVVLAAAAGATGALMRLASYILRLQLRPGAYVAVTLIYAFGGILVAIPLLVEGLGIEAVLIGYLVANLAAIAVAALLLRLDFRLGVSAREAIEIIRGGVRYLPIVLSFQVIQLGDTLLVARFSDFSQTGLYRVAQRLAMPVSYGTSVFQQAWGPMRRDLTHAAVDRLDEERAWSAHLATYYAVFVTALILTVAVLADQLVKLAAGDFGAAAELVPMTTIGVAGHGAFIFVYRISRIGIGWLVGLSFLGAAVFVVAAALLIPPLEALGAPLAAIAGWGVATATLLLVNQLRGKPIPFERRSLLLLLVLTLGAWAVSNWLLPESALGTAARLALLVGWACALLLFRVIPLAEGRALIRYARDAAGIDSKRRLRLRAERLDGPQGMLVEEIVRRRTPVAVVAERVGISESEAFARTVQALRAAAGGSGSRETDAELGRLIFVERPRAERDSGLLKLAAEGADPIDVDLVKRAAQAVAMAPTRTKLTLRRRSARLRS